MRLHKIWRGNLQISESFMQEQQMILHFGDSPTLENVQKWLSKIRIQIHKIIIQISTRSKHPSARFNTKLSNRKSKLKVCKTKGGKQRKEKEKERKTCAAKSCYIWWWPRPVWRRKKRNNYLWCLVDSNKRGKSQGKRIQVLKLGKATFVEECSRVVTVASSSLNTKGLQQFFSKIF